MRTNILKTLSLMLLIACFGKMNAQSDLLAANTVTSDPLTSEIIAKYIAEEKVKIGDFMPNPAVNGSQVNIRCSNPVAMKVKFFTMNGELAKEEVFNLEKGENALNVNIDNLDKGIYMVQFYSKEGSAVRRMMKSN